MEILKMSETIHISVVIPVYGCATSLPLLHERLTRALSRITDAYEIVMVNDASPDNAWKAIKDLAYKDPKVKGINLTKNFGQHRAITAGLDYAQGEWVVVMDCDLQDQPEEILKLYKKAQEGYDVVFGRRAERRDNPFKILASRLFYLIYDYFTGYKSDHTIANFSIISSKVVSSFRKMREQHKPYGYFVNWLGFKSAQVDVQHAKRPDGRSSYSFRKLIGLAIDNIITFSNKPLKISITIGFLMSVLSAIYAVFLIIRYFIDKVPVPGWTSVMVSIYFLAGLILANLGFLGLYIGKIFDETKKRPLYVVQETTFEDRHDQ
jgi:dolichol-phosphate mannosyltransferase